VLRNYFAAALRNLLRDRLYAVLNIVGLAVGLSAAIISGLYARDELTYEHFLPDYQHIYRISSGFAPPGGSFNPVDTCLPDVAPWLVNRLPAVQPIARLHNGTDAGVRVGERETTEHIYWADPAFFHIFRVPVVAGYLPRALERPDSLVITRSAARRLFGSDAVVGKTLELDRKYTLRVTAVIEDLPTTTHLAFELVASGVTQFSPLAKADSQPLDMSKSWAMFTYFLQQPGVSLESVRAALSAFEQQLQATQPNGMRVFLPVMPIHAIHLHEPGAAAMRSAGSLQMIYAIGAVGLLILGVSMINFVNLSTARASRRSVEVAVRKAAGATQTQLVAQFIGEAMLYAVLAAALALCLMELALPLFNRLSGASLSVRYNQAPVLLLGVPVLTLVAGVLAGAYPAFVLGSLRPVTALKGGPLQSGSRVRSILVALQFAVLIGLLCAIMVIFEQTSLAKRVIARLDTRNVFALNGACAPENGSGPADIFGAIPGVVSAACSESAPFGYVKRHAYSTVRAGIQTMFRKEVVDFGFFELYGLRPLAGRLFSHAHADENASVIINSVAARTFGFPSATAAVGQYVVVSDESQPSQIIGVVPDFPLESVRTPIEPVVFYIDRSALQTLSIRTSSARQEQTLDSVRSLWKKLQPSKPMVLFPVSQGLRGLYEELVTDGAVFGACAAVALVLACTGIFGLASFAVVRRAKEAGIRKAMGAARSDILRLFVGRLTRPVLAANLVAWPVCYVVLGHWLSGFAYHIDLGPAVFLAAGAVAVLIAWTTIVVHALRLASLKPVASLRYE
jgi:putative ABC transport system permease protein